MPQMMPSPFSGNIQMIPNGMFSMGGMNPMMIQSQKPNY